MRHRAVLSKAARLFSIGLAFYDHSMLRPLHEPTGRMAARWNLVADSLKAFMLGIDFRYVFSKIPSRSLAFYTALFY